MFANTMSSLRSDKPAYGEDCVVRFASAGRMDAEVNIIFLNEIVRSYGKTSIRYDEAGKIMSKDEGLLLLAIEITVTYQRQKFLTLNTALTEILQFF